MSNFVGSEYRGHTSTSGYGSWVAHFGSANTCQRIGALALKGAETIPIDEVLEPHLRSFGDGYRSAEFADQPQFGNDVFMGLMAVFQQQLCK